MDKKQHLNGLIELRQYLHQHPEISGEEINTANIIKKYLSHFRPDHLIQGVGGNGLIAEFKGKNDGPRVMFRCELDALPIQEENNLSYTSLNPNKGHLCGHDGHMAMVAGLSYYLNKEPPKKGKVFLLFQPSEETGNGAKKVIEDKRFLSLKPDYIFGIHNIPGCQIGTVILSFDRFASASRGMVIKLIGKSSHAAEPDKGNNPGLLMAKLLLKFNQVSSNSNLFRDFTLVTPIHTRLGHLSYGTSPGEAVLHFTLRSYIEEDMQLLVQKLEKIVQTLAKEESLDVEIDYEEVFLATSNNRPSMEIVQKLCAEKGLKIRILSNPFKWSEDFSHYGKIVKGGLIGLGSGIDQPALHNPNYNFPDQLIPIGLELYRGIYNKILNK